MKQIENIKLWLRANKYKNKHDVGGIAYIETAIKKGHTVFDIGAHKAAYLYFILKQVGAEGRVYAFEPQSTLHNYIKRMKGLLGWNNVTLEYLALSDSEGTVVLYIPRKRGGIVSSPGATIVVQKEDSDFVETENVQTQTLDAYCTQHNIKPDFLKIDVEGNELKIFQGGQAVLKKYKPKIIVEIEERHIGRERVLETINYLGALGYSGSILHGLNRVPLKDFTFEKYQNTNDMDNYCNNFIFE